MQKINWFIMWGPSSRRRAQITILEPTKAAHSIDKLHTLHWVQSIRKHLQNSPSKWLLCIYDNSPLSTTVMAILNTIFSWNVNKKGYWCFFFFVTQLKVLVLTFYHSNNCGCCFYSVSGWVKGRDPISQRGSVQLFWSFEYVSVLPKNSHGCIVILLY